MGDIPALYLLLYCDHATSNTHPERQSSMLLCHGNPFNHPSPEVVQRLIDRLGEDNVYRTDENGTIELITYGESLPVKADS